MNVEDLKKKILAELSVCDNAEQESGWIVSRATAIPVPEFLFQKRALTEKEIASAEKMADRRLNGEPLQYILGDEYFGDILLKVGKGCLIPRPETWGIVETLLPLIPQNGCCCELGTGSGAIAIAIAHARPDVKVCASELSGEALYWANRNLAAYQLKNVEFRQGSLFEPFSGMSFDAVAANLPYIPYSEKESLQKEVRDFEPEIALFAEDRGTELIKKALLALEISLNRGGIAMFEMGTEQAAEIAEYSSKLAFPTEVSIQKDCFGADRFVCVKRSTSIFSVPERP